MYRKLILLGIITSLIVFDSISITSLDLKEKETISVEVKGEALQEGVYEMTNGDAIEDLLEKCGVKESGDISDLSLQKKLYDGQLIVIGEKKVESLISINSASKEQLMSLPGIGPSIADRIIDYRENISSFTSLEDIMNVKGIGKATYERIREHITL